jgi:hypothetical protein
MKLIKINKIYRIYMKNIICSIGILIVTLLYAQKIQAQGVITYLSNLEQTSAGSNPVGNDSWLAVDVFTGNNPGGYVLNSIQLGMTDASGNPSGFAVMIYSLSSDPSGLFPGSSLDTLNGPANPSAAGIYNYIPASSLTLSASTDYFIVLTGATAVANGAYGWNFENAASYNPTDGWFARATMKSSDGSSSSWRINPPFNFSAFAITATPIPEPSSLALGFLGSGVLFHVRRPWRRYLIK